MAGRCLHLRRGSLAPSNCALAIVALELLTGEVSVAVDDLADQVLAGRMESSRYRGVEVISDVAHNPAAATFLAQQLDIRYPSRRYIGVLGMLADKDVAGVVAALGDRVQRWLTIATYGPREQGAGELANRIGTEALACDSVGAALDRACSLTEPGDGILVFGSFSAVEQARTLLHSAAESGERR